MLLVSRSGHSFSSAYVQLFTKSVVLSPPFSLCEETHWTAATVILFCWIDSWSGCNSKFREWPGSQGPVEVTTIGGLTVPEDIEPYNPYPSLIWFLILPLHTTSLRFECSEELQSGKICCEPSMPCYLPVGYQHCGLSFDCLCFLFLIISSRLDCIICACGLQKYSYPLYFDTFFRIKTTDINIFLQNFTWKTNSNWHTILTWKEKYMILFFKICIFYY